MAQTKITPTLKLDEEGDSDDMTTAIKLLSKIGTVPANKVVLSMECPDFLVESIEDKIDAALMDCPDSVDVTIKTTTERGVERNHKAANTPLEKAIRDFKATGATIVATKTS